MISKTRKRAPGRTFAAILLLVPGLILSSGCMTSRTADRVTAELKRELPELRLDKELGLTFGRLSMPIVKAAVRIADEDLGADEQAFLRGVRRIEVGIYRVLEVDLVNAYPRLSGLERRMTKQGWFNIVRTNEDGEHSWVYSKANSEGDLRGLLIVAFEDEELVVVRLDGKLQEALVEATKDDPQGIAEVFVTETDDA